MYELILGWALESLTQFTNTKDSKDLSIALEAIRTKNELVVERFKYAWTACQSIVDLAIKIEADLIEFQKTASKTDGTKESTEKYLSAIRQDFHPKYYRQLFKIRSQFESTNDLFSAYSEVLADIVHFSTLEDIATNKNLRSSSDISRTYRGLWKLYADIIIRLVRVTSNDLRFWLTDIPYAIPAEEWVKKDLDLAKQFLLAKDWGGKRFHITLESKEGLEQFWKAVEQFK